MIMGFMDKVKEFATKAFNGGYTPWEHAMAMHFDITPNEYRAMQAKAAAGYHINPQSGMRSVVLFHNSKYLPDGTLVKPGTPVTDWASKQMKAIMAFNRL